MKVEKGQALVVSHSRRGRFEGVALADFDTEADEWYPVATREFVDGLSKGWEPGEAVPCRRGLCTVEVAGGAE